MRPDSRRGLTMLEVLVAAVILVAIVAMVFMIMSSASNQTIAVSMVDLLAWMGKRAPRGVSYVANPTARSG